MVFRQQLQSAFRNFLSHNGEGRSGIGTTLSGSRIQLALIKTVLTEYFTEEAFAPLIVLARRLERGVADVIIKYELDWHVTRVGARVEFMCCEIASTQWL